MLVVWSLPPPTCAAAVKGAGEEWVQTAPGGTDGKEQIISMGGFSFRCLLLFSNVYWENWRRAPSMKKLPTFG